MPEIYVPGESRVESDGGDTEMTLKIELPTDLEESSRQKQTGSGCHCPSMLCGCLSPAGAHLENR